MNQSIPHAAFWGAANTVIMARTTHSTKMPILKLLTRPSWPPYATHAVPCIPVQSHAACGPMQAVRFQAALTCTPIGVIDRLRREVSDDRDLQAEGCMRYPPVTALH